MPVYWQVRWRHEPNDDPVMLYHEIGEDRWETRRVEEFADGELRYADQIDPEAPTSLSLEALPSIEDVRAQPEFEVEEIDRDEFERMWQRAVGR